jgi:hypothetical protein
MALLFSRVSQYRSSVYEIARGLLRSRNRLALKIQELVLQNRQLQTRIERLTKESQADKDRIDQIGHELERQRCINNELRQQPIELPIDLALPHHTFGPKMICLCLNLSRFIGFRPSETAMRIIFDWLGINAKVPSWDSIRCWACRVGVAQLQQVPEQADDWIWMTDHSNQIGTEKVLQILGIRASKLPPPGQTLRRQDMVILAVIPGKDWKREDVRREYKHLAERIGVPRYLLTDGAVELFESADVLEKPGKKLTVLRDMKHFAANAFEKLIGKDERFAKYLAEIGTTRSRIQQTELSHFTPPAKKPKARFMNLGPTLRWGQMVSYHLAHCHSKARKGITAARMNEKLGWLRKYRDDLASWNRCQLVMQASLKFINHEGLSKGSTNQLQLILNDLLKSWGCRCDLSKQMASALLEFVRESESTLSVDERTWLSTEPLESSFGMFKRLEGQHSKGGFTSLLAAMPMLLIDWTPERVRESLMAVSVKQMKTWVDEHLGTTLASKRATAYREFATTMPRYQ